MFGVESAISAFPGDQPPGFDFGIRRGHADAVSLAKCLDGNRALGGIVLHLPSFRSRERARGSTLVGAYPRISTWASDGRRANMLARQWANVAHQRQKNLWGCDNGRLSPRKKLGRLTVSVLSGPLQPFFNALRFVSGRPCFFRATFTLPM